MYRFDVKPLLLWGLFGFGVEHASAQPAPAAAPPPTPPAEPSPAEPAADREDAPPHEVDANPELSRRIDDLEAKLKQAEASRRMRSPIKLSGYGDLGLFATQGDGSGFRRDAGHMLFPDRSQYAWVFYGDILAPQVNSRGEVADLGQAPGVRRFDSIHSQGNPTFLVNELNLSVTAGLGDKALFTSSVNFTPRSGADFSLGDSFDVDLAELEWMPTDDGKTSIFIGKVDSVIGLEYKTRKPTQRFGITPTLLARYTTGTAVGVKLRSKLLGDHLIVAAAATNGSFGTEQFFFYQEVDTNRGKTLSGRVALRIPVGSGSFEIGPSGQYGTPDGTPNGTAAAWLVGGDAELDLGRIDLRAQWLKGKSPGDPIALAYALDLKQGGSLEADLLVTPRLGVFGRAEFRDAEVTMTMERLYLTKNWRAVGGVHLTLHPNATVKLEFTHNGEYGGTPQIADDVITTSAVLGF
ncbi:MAG TPA: hypothetical protein VHN14_12305 [Kofleriaceae bacterium]|jgi:hypothetical protein|nr:hypothetical protein [Kofleriaceae bacterium]